MYIEFTKTIYVSEEDIERMADICRTCKVEPKKAFWDVAAEWDDEDYYNAHYAEEKVIEAIKKILAK